MDEPWVPTPAATCAGLWARAPWETPRQLSGLLEELGKQGMTKMALGCETKPQALNPKLYPCSRLEASGLPVRMSVDPCPHMYLSIYPSLELSVYLSISVSVVYAYYPLRVDVCSR